MMILMRVVQLIDLPKRAPDRSTSSAPHSWDLKSHISAHAVAVLREDWRRARGRGRRVSRPQKTQQDLEDEVEAQVFQNENDTFHNKVRVCQIWCTATSGNNSTDSDLSYMHSQHYYTPAPSMTWKSDDEEISHRSTYHKEPCLLRPPSTRSQNQQLSASRATACIVKWGNSFPIYN
ncbi:uncharacterized protein HD556DRAFT_689500 [Suillus plorans]|uniref:Uncharacterized protein n=1 Tax=Suillus plorans TaxID=116603 RepID=A0A9P7AJB4_9AGAM|nr:uncharacterized protein HD556DRAFT_689500 [Suillus plorans]KAG1790708.1 hypothetical protein HD556DRAFT_689500 [Suillus plorans]